MQVTAGYHLELTRKAMGCQFSVYLPAETGRAHVTAAVEALDHVQALEADLSIFREESEISRINRSSPGEWIAIAEPTREVLALGIAWTRKTEGTFDIGAGRLWRLWGFHRKQGRVPDADDIEAALSPPADQSLQIQELPAAARRTDPRTEINLGAIGKGFAIDQAAAALQSRGASDFLLHGGTSTVWGHGSQDRGGPPGWLVDLKHPLFPQRRIARIRLSSSALSTSGNAAQSFIHQGRRYGHVIDPRSGYPAESLISTTVIAPTAALSDALSTACFVAGIGGAEAIAREYPDIVAILIAPGPHAGTVTTHVLGDSEDAVIWE